MASTRDVFLARLSALERVIPNALVQNDVFREVEHNESARLLRNGLMVVGVAALEDFIKGRTQELLRYLSSAGLSFSDLPQRMQQAATVSVFKSASGHLSRVWASLGDDIVGNIQAVALDVASTTAPNFTLSQFAFGFSNSNLTPDIVNDILKSFGLKNAWSQISRVAHRVGLASLSHEEAFRQALRNRHAAAHQAAAQTEPTDLIAFVQHAKGIAIGFDTIISRAGRLIAERDPSLLALDGLVERGVQIRFLNEAADGIWRDVPEGKRPYRKASTRASLERDSLARVRRVKGVLVIRDASDVPTTWFTTDVS